VPDKDPTRVQRPLCDDGICIKGDRLRIYRKSHGAEEPLSDGHTVYAGDLLQVAYVPAALERGVIISVDGNGQVTRHFPEDESGGDNLLVGRQDGSGLVALSHAYELDDAPTFERFFFVYTAPGVMLHTEEVEAAARRLVESGDAAGGALPMGSDGIAVEDLLLNKGEP
ncbi:MAG: hypothetical protein AAFX99_35865, partial [Myxococcota bacterium]